MEPRRVNLIDRTLMTSLTLAQERFIDSVLRLAPRVAAFDCDGTLWSGDAGEGFFSWELEQGLVSDEIRRWARPRYEDYRAGNVPEEVMCGEMATMHRGLREEVVQQAADRWFPLGIAPNIFPEMLELVLRLRQAGCDVWAVSSSNIWVIRAGMRYFDIPQDHILAAETAVEHGIILDHLLRMPSGTGKPEAIREAIKGAPDCAFGNSIWDREMLEMSRNPFAINPSPNLKAIAVARNWRIYQPEPNHRDR
jgi:phosphoserine phosphatase